MRPKTPYSIRIFTSLIILIALLSPSLAASASTRAAPTIAYTSLSSIAASPMAPEAVTLSNNSFETGDLSGWTVTSRHVEVLQSSDINSSPTHPISPTDGNYMALVCNGPGGIDTNELDNLDGDLGPNNDNDRSILSQTFTVGVGDVPLGIEFDWNWLTSEQPTPGNFDDFFMVTLNSGSILSGSAATGGVSPFPDVSVSGSEYTVNSTGSTNGCLFQDGQSGWNHFSHIITTPGVYTLSILVSDQGNNDHMIDSGLLLDNFQLAQSVDLKIRKSASPSPVVIAGAELLYTVTVDNLGLNLASSVVATDALPVDLLYLGSTGSCSEVSPNELSCPLGDLAPSESRSFVIKTLVPSGLVANEADGTRTITNFSGVSSSSTEINPYDNTTSLTTLVQDLADLRSTKVIEPEMEIQAGQNLTYTVFVDNLGPSYARNVKFTDQLLSSGLYSVVTVIDDPNRSDSCVTTPGFGTQTTTSLINCTLIDPLEPFGSNPSPPQVNVGRWMVKIILRPTTAPDITGVTDVFSSENTSGNPGTPDPDLSNNQAVDFVPVRLTADLQNLSFFGAEVQLNGFPGTIIDTNFLPPLPEVPGYNFGATTVTAGRRIQWDTSTVNDGPSEAQNTRIEVSLPYGASLIENTITTAPNPGTVQGRCYTEPPGELRRKVICEYGNLAVGATAALRFQVLVDPSLPSGTQLSFDSLASSETFDSNLSNNLTSIQFDVNNWADLAVQKFGNPSPVPAGGLTSYDITYLHKGPSTARNVLLTDVFPPGITPLSVEVIDGNLSPTDCHFRTGDPALVDSLVCELGDLLPGDSGQLVVTVRVKPDANPGLVTNTVFIESDASDPYSLDNTATFDTTISAVADLEIVKTGDPDKVPAGGEVVFTIKVTNHGPSDAHNVVVTDTLPLEMLYETSNFPGPALSEDAGYRSLPIKPEAPDSDLDCQQVSSGPDVVSCAMSLLRAGQTRVIEIYALVSPDAIPGLDLINYIEVNSETPDPEPDNNQDNTTTYVLGVDLAISKTAVGQILVQGEPFEGAIVGGFPNPDVHDQVTSGLLLTYTLTISNQGYTTAQNVVVTDKLPGGVTLMSTTSSKGICSPGVPGNPSLPTTCNLGSISGISSATITILLRVNADTPVDTILINQALVDNDLFDPNNSNDFDVNYITVVPPWWVLYFPIITVEFPPP